MKIRTTKQDLQIAVQRVQSANSDKSLGYIGLSSKNGLLQITASDKSIAVYCKVECISIQEGTCFIQSKLFCEIVRELPEGQVFLEQEDSFLKLHGGSSQNFEIKLPLISEAVWQESPFTNTTDTFYKIQCSKFSYMIDKVQPCVNAESPRNYATVAYLHRLDTKHLRLVGTDGYRLSHCDIEVDLPEEFISTEGVCISKRSLNELTKICQEGYEFIEIAINKESGTILARLPNYEVFIRLSTIKYPNYLSVIPKGNLNKIELSKNTVQSVAKRILLTSDKNKTLYMDFQNQNLTLRSKTTGSSEGKEQISIGENNFNNRIIVNGKYLADVLSVTESPEIELYLKETQTDPIVILPKQEPAGCVSKHVLVPIRESQTH